MSFAEWVSFLKEFFVVIVVLVHILAVFYGFIREGYLGCEIMNSTIKKKQLQKEEKE
jgi:hypothetical protein